MTKRFTVRIADFFVLSASEGEIATHSLGSCIGVSIYDPVSRIGGLSHFMLPMPGSNEHPGGNPSIYCTTALPALFKKAYGLGARKERLVVCAAGGSEMLEAENGLRIGHRNRTMLRKILWQNGVVLRAEDTGGRESRTMVLDLATGTVRIFKSGVDNVIWRAA
jgi:chemotaxis protein CheD